LLNHPTLDRLHELGLDGIANGFRDLAANPESRALKHAERLGLLVDQEATLRREKRFEARTRIAKFRQQNPPLPLEWKRPVWLLTRASKFGRSQWGDTSGH
jgi:hypothetical protein